MLALDDLPPQGSACAASKAGKARSSHAAEQSPSDRKAAVSPEGGWVTGQVLEASGGYRL